MPSDQDLFNCCIELMEVFTLACQSIEEKKQLYIKDGVEPITNFNIVIKNPSDNENYYTIDFVLSFLLSSSSKNEVLVENVPYYTRKILNDPIVVEEIFTKFISLISSKREVEYIKNAIYDDIEYDSNVNMGMIPIIYLEDGISIILPENDLRYMDIIVESSKRAIYQDYSILKIARENGFPVSNINVDDRFSNEIDYLKYLIEKARNKIGDLDFKELTSYYDLINKRKKRLKGKNR